MRACDARTGTWGPFFSDSACRTQCERDKEEATPTPESTATPEATAEGGDAGFPTPTEVGFPTPTVEAGGNAETWSGELTSGRFVCNAEGGTLDGKLEGKWTLTFTLPRSLTDALSPGAEVWSREGEYGDWSGSESNTVDCSDPEYDAVGGSVSHIAVEAYVHHGAIHLLTKNDDAVLLPGAWVSVKNTAYRGGSISGVNLVATSVTPGVVSGTFDLNPGTGTFTLRKQG